MESILLETVHHHKVDIENLFIPVVAMENDDEWVSETLSSARGFLTLLRDFDFNFFLNFFSSHFPLFENLLQVLQTKTVGQVAQAARRLAMGWTARVSEGWRFFFAPSCPD